MVLILSCSTEKYSEQVETLLREENIPCYRLNFDVESIKHTFIQYHNDDIELTQFDKKIFLSEVKVAWLKVRSLYIPHKEEQEFGGFADEINFNLWRTEWNSVIRQLISFLKHKNVKWVDNPISLSEADFKIPQLHVAKNIGFKIPKTLISNNKSVIESFLSSNKDNILKLSTQPSFYINDDVFFIYTNKITKEDLKDFDNCVNSPMIFQEYIEKQFEVRYTFVNNNHFVCRIDSQVSEKSKTDWRRYDLKNTPYLEIEPPKDIREKVNHFMKTLNLNYGALDFIVDQDNQWWFLEINSVGQYGWIEQLTGMPITRAIVDYMKHLLNI
jgi:glutathione synthase/RimK-type ligase-like ATP-grasp enzyme